MNCAVSSLERLLLPDQALRLSSIKPESLYQLTHASQTVQMETAPPSYEAATLTDVLTVIAPYLHSSDLCSATLVSKRFYRTIAPRLWGSPALHIGLEHDGIDDRLARFQKILQTARSQTRDLVHTLYIPSSKALYFDDRPADWLLKLLQRLPRLQALCVAGLLYFDHNTLQTFASTSQERQPGEASIAWKSGTSKPSGPIYRPALADGCAAKLKLLDASRCENLTAPALAKALPCFPSLIYLDLSECSAARHAPAVASLHHLRQLKILRLRAVGMTDSVCLVLAEAIGRRVTSLDLSGNLITDSSVQVLTQTCIGNTPNYDYMQEMTRLRPADLAIYRSTSMEKSVSSSLTRNFVNGLAIEDLNEQGITHLSLADNQLSSASIHTLLDQYALNVLDVGEATAASAPRFSPSRHVDGNLVHLRLPSQSILLSGDDTSTSMFHPALYPHLQTLVLANLPVYSRSDNLVAALIKLIEQLATEQQRRSESPSYMLPPGDAEASSQLAVIVLEMSNATSPKQKAGSHTADQADRSYTNDKDGASMWSAAGSDFSFFDEPTEGGWQTKPPVPADTYTQPLVDNIALLSAFRSQRKAARARDISQRGQHSVTPGYWTGRIEVNRDALQNRRAKAT